MTGVSSTPLAQRQVFAQDTEPTTTRDGVLWVDTSEPSRPTYVFSGDTGEFEPIYPSETKREFIRELARNDEYNTDYVSDEEEDTTVDVELTNSDSHVLFLDIESGYSFASIQQIRFYNGNELTAEDNSNVGGTISVYSSEYDAIRATRIEVDLTSINSGGDRTFITRVDSSDGHIHGL